MPVTFRSVIQVIRGYYSRMSSAELEAIDRRIEALLRSQEVDREEWRSLRKSQAETDRQMKETDRQIKESQSKTDRQIKELGQQIGGLGNKFGTFAEGLSYASIEKILREDFELNEFVTPAVKMRKKGREEEYDVLAYSNGSIDKGMIVEIKSRLRQEDIDQMKRKMDEVFYWLPEHTNVRAHPTSDRARGSSSRAI